MNNYTESPMKMKVYKKRWFILFLYILYTAISQFQWVEYAIIGNIAQKYYNVGYSTVNWTAMVFMLVYPIFVVPASYIIDKQVSNYKLNERKEEYTHFILFYSKICLIQKNLLNFYYKSNYMC